MERVYITDIRKHLNQEIKLQGFVDSFRDNKAMAFVVLRDITGRVQITIEKVEHPEMQELWSQLTPDSVITVVGTAVASEYVKLNGLEVIQHDYSGIRSRSSADSSRGNSCNTKKGRCRAICN